MGIDIEYESLRLYVGDYSGPQHLPFPSLFTYMNMYKGGRFQRNCGAASVREYNEIILL